MTALIDHDAHFGARREAPANIEAEMALLGAVLINNDVLDALELPIEGKHFFETVHRDMFDAFLDMRKAGRKINPVTAKAYMPDGMIGTMTPSQYLARLASEAVSAVNAPDFARSVMDAAARRSCVMLGDLIGEAAFSKELDISDEIEALKQRFEDVLSGLTSGNQGKTLADAARTALNSTALAVAGKGVIGIDYGVPFLMNMIGPFLPGQEIIIGGMTKHGKSTLIEQIVAGAAMNGHPVWVNSGEMKGEELAQRALARLTDIRVRQQVMGRVTDHEYEKLETARRNAERWQERVFIRDDSMTLSQIKRELVAFSKRNPGALGVVDHIGLVEKGREHAKTNDVEFASVVTRSLKMIASSSKVPIVAAAQLKKNTFEQFQGRTTGRKTYFAAIGRRPKASDLYGSCEKDANHVLIPFRSEAVLQEMEPSEQADLHVVWDEVMETVRGTAEIVLALSRHERWPQKRSVKWNGGKTQFEEMNADAQVRMF